MSKIIFLNGCGSSGKTSIARSIQNLSSNLWLTFGVDTFIDMMPVSSDGKKEARYFSFVPGKNTRGPTMRIETGPDGDRLFGVMPDFANLLAGRGNNLIIDEILFDDIYLKSYINALQDHSVYFIGIFCDLAIMQGREISRSDRAIGLSNDQMDRVHAGLREYDLNVDTSIESPSEVARQILNFVENTPSPQGFINMQKKLK